MSLKLSAMLDIEANYNCNYNDYDKAIANFLPSFYETLP